MREFTEDEMREIEMFDLPDREPGDEAMPAIQRFDGCSACGFDVLHDHAAGDRPFTFVLRYGEEYGDEMDVWARSSEAARELATLVANEVYRKGWTDIQSIALGGSGGWVSF